LEIVKSSVASSRASQALVLESVVTAHTPESLVALLRGHPGGVLLHSGGDIGRERCSFVTTRPFLTLRSRGFECEIGSDGVSSRVRGNPWQVLAEWMRRYESSLEDGLPFPAGGCFGFWGYDLRHFLEPNLSRLARNDLDLPDCHVGFHDSLVVFDHLEKTVRIVSTGLAPDGSRSLSRARQMAEFWHDLLSQPPPVQEISRAVSHPPSACPPSTLSHEQFIAAVVRAQQYIRAGDIYQVNLSHRLDAAIDGAGWDLWRALNRVSPAPFSAFLDCGDFQLASSSPELFLRIDGNRITTRPIKGTRPRSDDPAVDARLAAELQSSAKENAELLMITDLLRNDVGRVCEYGSVQVPVLARLERFAQVQHLVSTVEGVLRQGVTHLDALAACFPGGSITGAPKIRAMQIIDELEPVTRGPYTGALGYLGFNNRSQFSIIIRSAICSGQTARFQVGAGIVADSDPAAEYQETLAKAGGFLEALRHPHIA
jgi:para-aminobenzoate synthetase component 1